MIDSMFSVSFIFTGCAIATDGVPFIRKGKPGTVPDGAVTGESLRSRREALGISQAAVAHAAHCSRGLVAEVERGRRRSAMTLSHLSQVLDKLEQQARRN
ncbi:MAG: XRE family transcriptional regulator [Chloroflexi bacterium]|nr:XRE family transcriptional regulator [Chloroflexota bacterium]